jgi:hypothetical protein
LRLGVVLAEGVAAAAIGDGAGDFGGRLLAWMVWQGGAAVDCVGRLVGRPGLLVR